MSARMLRHLEGWKSLCMDVVTEHSCLPKNRKGPFPPKHAHQLVPGVKLLEFTYGQQDKKSFISPQHP